MFLLENIIYKNILNIETLELSSPLICLYGPSGSGKTTLLRLLNKLVIPDSGVIHYKNKVLKDLDTLALRRRVVMLGQTPVLYPGNIRDNLVVGLKFSHKTIPPNDKLQNSLNRTGLKKDLSENCNTLSGGEKQRLCLARVQLMEAETYLLDEPSASLDQETESYVISNMMQFIKEKNTQLILVTHSNNILKNFSGEKIGLENGRIQ